MAGFRNFLKLWLPVVVWMILIFSASTGGGSYHQTSRFIEPVLRWISPAMTDETVYLLVGIIRKTAHVVEYSILSMLLWRALGASPRNETRAWSWRRSNLALAIAALYAMTDEFHQAFVPSRGASVLDVALDIAGAATGLGLIWLWGKYGRRW